MNHVCAVDGNAMRCLTCEHAICARHARFRRAGLQAACHALSAMQPLTEACGCTNLSVAARSDRKLARGKHKDRFGNPSRFPETKQASKAERLREAVE